MHAYESEVEKWLQGTYEDQTKAEIRRLQREDPGEIDEAFSGRLTFGTAGLRGLMGVGPNRFNVYSVRATSLGVANFLREKYAKHPSPLSIAIGFDSRHHSALFARQAACLFAAQGLQIYLFSSLKPTPLLSFACLYKKCQAAIMITASHNPPQYNGYKVYGENGAQITSPEDEQILYQIEKIEDWSCIELADEDSPLIHLLDDEIDRAYRRAIAPLQSNPRPVQQSSSQLHLVYSSFHGTGASLLLPTLKEWGFSRVDLVREQSLPDGNFPTLPLPNPEEKNALSMGIEQMMNSGADLFIATDPDADRMGAVINHRKEPFILNGNQIAALLADYLCSTRKKSGELCSKHILAKSLVTSDLLCAIANHYSISHIDLLPGFKYIGKCMREWEKRGEPLFLLGAEESHGYLIGTHARDKDAIITSCILCEMALCAKQSRQTLIDWLFALYQTHGVYCEKVFSLPLPQGEEGEKKKQQILHTLSQTEQENFATLPIETFTHHPSRTRINYLTGLREEISLPAAQIFSLSCSGHRKVIIRPSGTEPKIKVYLYCHFPASSDIVSDLERGERELNTLFTHVEGFLSNF